MSSRLFLLLCLSACGGGNLGTADAGTDAAYGHKKPDVPEASVEAATGVDCSSGDVPSATYPGAHPAMPQIVSSGGPVLASPRFVPIVFAAEDRTSDIAAFMKALGTSTYWTGIASDYGIGAAAASDPLIVNETPPAFITDGEIETWLATKITTPDTSAIYTIYYPAATTIGTAWGGSCEGFGSFLGYHSETTIGSTHVVYAVIARCPTTTVTMTGITSHELFEAASDPYFYTAPAYQAPPSYLGAQEIGDLCEWTAPVVPSDVGYPVQRIWSNSASAAGRQPCAPSDGVPFFRTLPESLPVQPARLTLAPGASTTLGLLAFSDMPAGPWTVSVRSTQQWLSDEPSLALCRTSAQNGERIPLTIVRPSTAVGDAQITVTSTLGDAAPSYTFTVGD